MPKFVALLCLLVNLAHCQTSSCPEKLLWNTKLNMGMEDGLQLQVCCNVSRVEVHKLSVDAPWTVDGPPVVKQLVHDEKDIWSALQLSVCSDKPSEPTLGFVESRADINCSYPQGHIISVSPDMFQMNRWYVICYHRDDGCSYCHFEVLCDNDYSMGCSEVWIQSSANEVGNDSMTVWASVGQNMPFATHSALQITVRDQHTNVVKGRFAKTPQLGKTVNVRVDRLEPGNWYAMDTCLDISPPMSFQQRYHVTLGKPKPVCQRKTFRTLGGPMSSDVSTRVPFRTTFVTLFLLLLQLFSCSLLQQRI